MQCVTPMYHCYSIDASLRWAGTILPFMTSILLPRNAANHMNLYWSFKFMQPYVGVRPDLTLFLPEHNLFDLDLFGYSYKFSVVCVCMANLVGTSASLPNQCWPVPIILLHVTQRRQHPSFRLLYSPCTRFNGADSLQHCYLLVRLLYCVY